jgi:iron complex outermembrane receptor protein
MPGTIPHLQLRLLAGFVTLLTFASFTHPSFVLAQGSGTVTGRVTGASDGRALGGVTVAVQGLSLTTVTNAQGAYRLARVPAGEQTITFRWLLFRPSIETVTVVAGGMHTVDAELEARAYRLSEITVEAPSRAPERILDATSAVTVVEAHDLARYSATGQLPLALETTPGVELVQSGVYDFDVNARGVNNATNRRMLLLQDGRDVSLPLAGSQFWNALSIPMEDMARLELVRGPGSALYGADAYNGVISITTPTAREVTGTKVTLAGGELETFRGDLRHAGVLGDGRFGYRINVGYRRSDTWDRSRTLLDGSSCAKEYAEATDDPVPPNLPCTERAPLLGQMIADSGTGAVSGDRNPIRRTYGSARFDYYGDNGAVGTVEGGVALDENVLYINQTSRFQIEGALRPWARAAWAHPRYHVTASWSGFCEVEGKGNLNLGSGRYNPAESTSCGNGRYQFAGQYQRAFWSDRGRIVAGASYDLEPGGAEGIGIDHGTDRFFGVHAQVEYQVTPQIRAVVASRLDDSNLHALQWSPKAALVFSPAGRHAVRIAVNRAFQTPSKIDYFVAFPARSRDLSSLEAELRMDPVTGPALAGVPDGELFGNSSRVPVVVVGNQNLEVEKVTSYEVGYRGEIRGRVYVSVDAFYARLTDFVTPNLFGVNPDVPPWTAPTTVPDADRSTVENAARGVPGLSRLDDDPRLGRTIIPFPGQTAIVLSRTNAGKADQAGVELAISVAVSPEVRASGSYTYFTFDVKEGVPGTTLEPNTAPHKGAVSIGYHGREGIDLTASAVLVSAFNWRAGDWVGTIPDRRSVTVTAGYLVNNHLRLRAIATNVFDQQRFHKYGGSVIGRRVLAGVTAMF